MRTRFIVGNWKMNKTAAEASVFVREFTRQCTPDPRLEVGLAPPFTALQATRDALGNTSFYQLGAQDMYWEDKGAFTGEVSGPMLKEPGCQFVIIGHSERRQYFGEQDQWTNKKVQAALRHGLRPLLCVGESLADREAGLTEAVVTRQIRDGLAGLQREQIDHVLIAYEPVWAIGTGRAATPEQAVAVHQTIRATIGKSWSGQTAQVVRILYGGSITPQNIAGFLTSPEIDGALVGGACLDPTSFATLCGIALDSHISPR